jgi:hypothetical protein
MRKGILVVLVMIFMSLLNSPARGDAVSSATIISHTGDLVVENNDTFIIENAYYQQMGNIIVRENGTLIVRYSTLEVINQTVGQPCNVTIQDEGKFEIVGANLRSSSYSYLTARSNSSINILESNFETYIFVDFYDNSSVHIESSVIPSIDAYGFSTISLSKMSSCFFYTYDNVTLSFYSCSSIGGFFEGSSVLRILKSSTETLWIEDSSILLAYNSTIQSICATGSSKTYLYNSTIVTSLIMKNAAKVTLDGQSNTEYLTIKVENARLCISEVTEGYMKDSIVYTEPQGLNLTVVRSTVRNLRIEASGASYVFVQNSELDDLILFSSSSATILDSRIDWLELNGETLAIILNSGIGHTNYQGGRMITLTAGLDPRIFYASMLIFIGVILLLLWKLLKEP